MSFNFSNAPFTGNGDSLLYQGLRIDGERKQPAYIFIFGNFAGATVTAYACVDGNDYLPVAAGITAPGIMVVNVTATSLKLTVTGASNNTSITAQMA